MKRFKKMLMMGLATAMAMSAMSMSALANDTTDTTSTSYASTSDAEQLNSSDVEYISVADYIEKYGENNVIVGFNKAEAQNKVNLLGDDTTATISALAAGDEISTEPNDLYLSLQEGTFLGLEIEGVADLPPDNVGLSLKLKYDYIPTPMNVDYDSIPTTQGAVGTQTVDTSNSNYTIYYTDTHPGDSDIQQAYESTHGTYMYKFAYAYDDNYRCSTEVTFSGSQLKNNDQNDNNNMYVYIAAKSSTQTVECGLMANPSASNRNAGMYAYYNKGDGSLYPDAYPKVLATTSGTTMNLENKTIRLQLTIDKEVAEDDPDAANSHRVEMCMYSSSGDLIYNQYLDDAYVSSLVSGVTNTPLTFLQAMSCVNPNGTTSLTSGSCFTNVTFNNTKLYSYTNGTRNFSTTGAATYYTFIAKPSKMSFSYSGNKETLSINYN